MGDASRNTFAMEEVSRHCTRENCWIVLHGRVLDVTGFLGKHPGGEKVILSLAGQDATSTFEPIHASSGGFGLVRQWAPGAFIGTVAGWDGQEPEPTAMQSRKAVNP